MYSFSTLKQLFWHVFTINNWRSFAFVPEQKCKTESKRKKRASTIMDVTTSLSKFCLSQNACNGHYFSWSVHWSNRFPWSLLMSDTIPASQYKDELERLCCLDGMHVIPLSYSCERRSEYIQDGEACVKAFLHCCKEIEAHREEEKEQSLILARSKSRQGLGSNTHSMFQPSSKSKLVCEWMVRACDQTGDLSRVHSCDTHYYQTAVPKYHCAPEAVEWVQCWSTPMTVMVQTGLDDIIRFAVGWNCLRRDSLAAILKLVILPTRKATDWKLCFSKTTLGEEDDSSYSDEITTRTQFPESWLWSEVNLPVNCHVDKPSWWVSINA